MAKSKKELITRGKELGLNLNSRMSIYELEHRIKDKEAEMPEQEKEKKSTHKAKGGEY